MSGSLPDRSEGSIPKGGYRMGSSKKYVVGLTTAAMVLSMVATSAGVSAASAGTAPFSDIAGNSEAGAITFLSTIGAINGVGGGLYDPSAPVTREEMAKIVVNLAGKGNVATALQNETPSFTDAASIDTWAWGYVNVAADMGIVNGFPDGSFQPQAPVTDVQVAAMLIRAIGDQNQVIGSWPGNYVAAAFNLGINTGVTFVANLPATRGDVAQMSYEAAVNAPVYTATTTNNITTYAKGGALYSSGVAGNTTYTGTVTGVSTGNITWSNNGTAMTKNWESTYQLVGITTLSSLIGESVIVNVDGNGNVNYLTLAPNNSATSSTGTLADGSTAVPSGYFGVNSNYPWLVTSSYGCSDSSSNQTPNSGCAGNYYLLLGGTTPTTVQLNTYATTTGGTTFEVNPSSDGSDLGTVADVTYLTQDDSVSYTVNGSKIASLVESNANDQIGVVTSTWCASGCDNGINAAATPQIQVTINGTNHVVNVQSYTQLTLNGASATVSKSLDNAVAYVSTVGGYGTNTSGAANPGTGDGNAATIALYQNQVTGTVTALNTSSGAPNTGSTNTAQVSSFTLSLSNGTSQTYTADANFDSGSLVVGAQVTVALDSAGSARKVISTSATNSPTVAIVESTGSSSSVSGGTSYTIGVQDGNGSQTFDVNVPYLVTGNGNAVFSSTYANLTGNGNNGAILFVTNAQGQAVAPGATSGLPTAMTLDTPQTFFPSAPSTDTLAVVSTTSGSTVLGLYNSSGNIDTVTSTNPYVSIVAGNAFKASNGNSIGFGGLSTGSSKNVAVYQATVTANGASQNYYAVVAMQQ